MNNSLKVITEPAFEPVTLREARLWCRLDDDDTTQDAVVLLLIGGMRRHAEHYTQRAFARRQYELRLDAFPDAYCGQVSGYYYGQVVLPMPPLVSVDYVQYIALDGTLQSLDTSPQAYRVFTHSEPGQLLPLYQQVWPLTRLEPEAVRIGFTAGYPSAGRIPDNLKLWMQARISTLYENREQLIQSNQVQIPRDFADGLLDDLVTGDRFF